MLSRSTGTAGPSDDKKSAATSTHFNGRLLHTHTPFLVGDGTDDRGITKERWTARLALIFTSSCDRVPRHQGCVHLYACSFSLSIRKIKSAFHRSKATLVRLRPRLR